MVEKMIEWYGKLKGLKYLNLRYFNVCGASSDGSLGDSRKPSLLLVQNAVRAGLGIEPFYLTCPEVKTPDKTPIRDYIDVLDLSEAHLLAFNYLLKGGSSDIMNLGAGLGYSVYEIIREVEKVTKKKINFKRVTPRKGEYSKMIASNTKAKKVLGWFPKRTIGDSVKSLMTWYEKHPRGWTD